MTINEQIVKRLERLKDDIRARMEAENENASHKTERSLQVVNYEGGVKLVFAEGEHAPSETLEIGRKGGAVPRGFTAIIRQWAEDKGLGLEGHELNRFAYLTARKIARQGTRRHTDNKDIYSTLVNECARDITDNIGAIINEQIKTR